MLPDEPTASNPQLSLPLLGLPEQPVQFGLREAHAFPLVARGKSHPLKRRPARLAWGTWEEIELRTPNSLPVLVLDVDTPFAECLGVAQGSAAVRVPNWITVNPATGHSHVVYTLARPVLYGAGMKEAPLRFHARIAEFYRAQYRADCGYTGVLSHNPCHPKWRTEWLREAPWTLPELAEPIPKDWRIPKEPTTPEGRNCKLFRAAMKWFGKPSNWDASTDVGTVLAWIEAAFSHWRYEQRDWHRNETLWIAKSVVRYCRANLASGQTQRQFSLLQTHRGKRGGVASGKVRYEGSNEQRRPWEAEGISRRTWYRRRARKVALEAKTG